MALHEREFFIERPETKIVTFTCSRCRRRDHYQVQWIRRTRKERIPAGGDERDHALFATLRDYLIRADDVLVCKECQRDFEIRSQQPIVFI